MSNLAAFSKDDKNLKNEDSFVGVLQDWHDSAKKDRQKFDWNWYLYDNFYKGNHYIQFNKRTGQIIIPPMQKGQVRVTVNKAYSICRAIRNFATSYRPKWEVQADSTTEEEVNNSVKSSETLDFYYNHLKIAKLTKGGVLYALKYGIFYFQYGWDDEAVGLDNQMGEAKVWIRDPFDVYPDPAGVATGDIQNCRFIDIATSTPVQEIVNNPNYRIDKEKLTMESINADDKRAASDFKQMIIMSQYSSNFSGSKELGTKILHETWYKKRVKTQFKVNEKDEKGEAIEKEESIWDTEVWIATWIDGVLLRNEKTEFDKYNLIPCSSDNNPNELYGEGYIKHLVPIMKVLNRLESQILEYNNLVNRGRILAEKGHGIKKVTNENGEIVEHATGKSVQYWNPQGLAPDIYRQIDRMNAYLDDISGVQEAFMGRVPEGIKAGVALESLKAQTANNLQDLKDNLEEALAELGEAILDMIARKLITSRQIQATGKNGKKNNFKIMGQVGVDPGSKLPEDTFVIGRQNKVRVVIGSGLAYTREGRISRLDKLLEQGVIDPQTYLEHMEFGDVDEITKRAAQSKFDNAMLANIEKNGMPGMQGPIPQGGMPPAGGPMPPGNSPQGPQSPAKPPMSPEVIQSFIQLAQDENEQMIAGKVLPGTEGAPVQHTEEHIKASQDPKNQENEEFLTNVLQHIKDEEAAQGMPPIEASMPAQGGQNA